jgi:hypothetical protein
MTTARVSLEARHSANVVQWQSAISPRAARRGRWFVKRAVQAGHVEFRVARHALVSCGTQVIPATL